MGEIAFLPLKRNKQNGINRPRILNFAHLTELEVQKYVPSFPYMICGDGIKNSNV